MCVFLWRSARSLCKGEGYVEEAVFVLEGEETIFLLRFLTWQQLLVPQE